MALPPDRDPIEQEKREKENAKNLKKIKEALADRKSVRSPKARAERRENAKQQKSILGTFFGSMGKTAVGGAVGAISDVVGSLPIISQVADTVATATKTAAAQAKENRQIRKEERKQAEQDRKQAEQDRQQEIRDDEEAAELRKQAIKDELEAKLKAERDAGQITPGTLGVIGKDPNEENITENASNEREEIINRLDGILNNTGKDPDQKLLDKERKNELKKKKKDAPVVKKGTKEGGGLLGGLGSLLSGGLSGIIAAAIPIIGGLGAGLLGVLGPALAIIGTAALAAGLGTLIFKSWIEPWMEKKTQEEMNRRNRVSRVTQQQQMFETEEGKKEKAFNIKNALTGETMKKVGETEAKEIAKQRGFESLEEAEAAGAMEKATFGTRGGVAMAGQEAVISKKSEAIKKEKLKSFSELEEQAMFGDRSAAKKQQAIMFAKNLMEAENRIRNAMAGNDVQAAQDAWDAYREFVTATAPMGTGMYEFRGEGTPLLKRRDRQRIFSIFPLLNEYSSNGNALSATVSREENGELFVSGGFLLGGDYNSELANYPKGSVSDLSNIGPDIVSNWEELKGSKSFRRGGVGRFGKGTPAMLHGTEAIIPLSKVATGSGLNNIDPVSRALLMTIAANSSGSTEMQAIIGNIQNRQMQANNIGDAGGTAVISSSPTTNISNTSNTVNTSSKGPTKMTEPTFRSSENSSKRSEMFG